ncbi:sigma 54-interacting transcriptional regulator [Roseibacterium sp. SDUM158016]|uniref:sigma-54-dependent transcriptional regulator n=1 Tax=Roseicyclus sediminis TaxID=2980997 RepID=UPI0021D15686|nr:sigma 54-interacting transcriptional regulator [Roseibacterium sp. SDUM158016]MCU4654194.1 sigma 54-interacting transcriptional regulator [Roseibacterium sp. SDUM158016]
MKDAGHDQRATVLLVDPDGTRRERLRGQLSREAECLSVGTGAEALKECQENFIEVAMVACGNDTPEGVPLLDQMAAHWPETVRIALAEEDARDLPDDLYQICRGDLPPEGMRRMLRNAVQLFRVRRENDRMSFEMRFMSRKAGPAAPPEAPHHDEGLGFEAILRAATSPMAATVAQARHLASFDVPLLLTGAPGTGKTALARAIHGASLRADRPFLALDVTGLPEEAVRIELCGLRNNGSSRIGLIPRASRGTLYLGGIEHLSPSLQLWLSRMLATSSCTPVGATEPGRMDIRLICGTGRDLRRAVAEGRFRAELYHQVAVGTLDVPSLDARREDVALLAQHMLFEVAARHGKSVRGLNAEAMEFLAAYDWPGNLPELRNEVTRMLIYAQDPVLGPDLVSRHILQARPGAADPGEDAVLEGTGPLKDRVEAIEKRILREVLTRLKWNKSRAAQELGLSRVGLRAKVDRYGLCPGVIETVEEG